MNITIQDVHTALTEEVVIGSKQGTSAPIHLMYTPLTHRYNIYVDGKPVWAAGERNPTYAVRTFNDMV